MKSVSPFAPCGPLMLSPPARGAWIEISVGRNGPHSVASPPARGAWIEMFNWWRVGMELKSPPPARGAWIEIMMEGYSIYRMLSDRAKDLKAKADAK